MSGPVWSDFSRMNSEEELEALRSAALQGIVDGLRLTLDVGRCTLRLDRPGETYPVVCESCADGVRSLIGDTEVDLRGQPVVRIVVEEGRQEVEHDSRAAFDDPAFQRMLDSYGNVGAQIVTPIRHGGGLAGILSVHHLAAPRRWSDDEIDLAAGAASLLGRLL